MFPEPSGAKNYGTVAKLIAFVAVLVVSGIGVCSGLYIGYLVATSISADPAASSIGQVIGALVGIACAIWFIAVTAKRF
jgi:hypothetical protein